MDCYFSKEYFDDFIFDCQLVLNSKAYFQLNGGGMCAMAFFSKVPYLICAQITSTEYFVTKSKKKIIGLLEIKFSEKFVLMMNFITI